MDAHRLQPPPSPPPLGGSVDHQINMIGKHRMAAAITHLHQQISILEEELDRLETIGPPSIVCKGLISSVESVPDPLLPTTKGPADMNWERWFGGAQSSRSRKRWI